MTKVTLPSAKAQELMAAVRTGYVITVSFGYGMMLFWKGEPVAISDSGFVYHRQREREAGCTKAIDTFEPQAPHVACDAGTFDFIIGSMLTRFGLPLTTNVKGGKDA